MLEFYRLITVVTDTFVSRVGVHTCSLSTDTRDHLTLVQIVFWVNSWLWFNNFSDNVSIFICNGVSIFVRYDNRFGRYNFSNWFTVFVRDNFSVIISDNPGDGSECSGGSDDLGHGSTVTVRHDISVI